MNSVSFPVLENDFPRNLALFLPKETTQLHTCFLPVVDKRNTLLHIDYPDNK